MQTQFTASQTVDIPIQEAGVAIEAYLENPRRIISGLTDQRQVELLSEDTFRFSLSPLSFMALELKPTADLKIWSPRAGRIRIQALRCWLEGAEHLNQHFSMTMEGSLRVTRQTNASPEAVMPQSKTTADTGSRLYKKRLRGGTPVKVRGKAELTVIVDLPLPFSLTPKPIIETAGNALLSGILGTIQSRLKRQLVEDYQTWAAQEVTVNASR